MFSLYRSWKKLPTITVVSDGSWKAADFCPVFSWWPTKLEVLSREQIITDADAAGERELAHYAEASGWGLKVASIVLLARREPVLFVDADILWFADPAPLLGTSDSWAKPRGVRESNCYQHREMALRFCPEVLQPPFVNGGILALHGEFLSAEILRAMVNEALTHPDDGAFEQTIIASAVHRGVGLLPGEINLVEFDDINRFRHRNMLQALATPEWKSRNWRLDFFGSGSDAKYIQDVIRYFGLEDRVTLRGFERDFMANVAERRRQSRFE